MYLKLAGQYCVRGLLSVMLWLGLSAAASADIYEFKSKNFIFTGDISQDDGRALIVDLETYRSAVLAVLGVRGAAEEIRPVQIYGVDGTRALRKYSGASGIAGAYAMTDEGPIYIMNTKGGVEKGDEARLIALHEYAHHIMARYTTKRYPRWYSEGFAEYLSTYFEDDGVINIGNPNVGSVSGVRNEAWISMNRVMGAIKDYPSRAGTLDFYMFYGQSWLSVHYIMNDPEMSKQVNPYINAVNGGAEPLAAFEAAFGVAPAEFGKVIRAYLRAKKFPVMRFHRKETFDAGNIAVRKLGETEARTAMQFGRLAFSARSKTVRNDVNKQLSAVLKSDPSNADALVGMAQFAFFDKDIDGAIAKAKAAKATDPSHKHAHYMHGDIYFHKAVNPDVSSEEKVQNLKMSIDLLEQHLKLDPTHPTSNAHYIDALNVLADEQGLNNLDKATARQAQITKSIEFLVGYFRNDEWAINRLSSIRALAMIGGQSQACELFGPIKENYTLGEERHAVPDGWYNDLVRRCG